MFGTKEFYDIIEMFEKEFKGEFRFDRENKEIWSKGYVYQHGDCNRMFQAFLRGVSFGKLYYRD